MCIRDRTKTGLIGIVSTLVAFGQKLKDEARIAVYDIIDEELIYTLRCGSSMICVIGSDYILVCSGSSIQIWNIASKILVKTIESGRNSEIACVSKSGNVIALGYCDQFFVLLKIIIS